MTQPLYCLHNSLTDLLLRTLPIHSFWLSTSAPVRRQIHWKNTLKSQISSGTISDGAIICCIGVSFTLFHPLRRVSLHGKLLSWNQIVLYILLSSMIFHLLGYCKTLLAVELMCLFFKNADLPQMYTVHALPFRPSSVLGLTARGKDVRICLSWAIQYFHSAVKLINNLEIKSIFSLIFITVGFAYKPFVLAFPAWVGKHSKINVTDLVSSSSWHCKN